MVDFHHHTSKLLATLHRCIQLTVTVDNKSCLPTLGKGGWAWALWLCPPDIGSGMGAVVSDCIHMVTLSLTLPTHLIEKIARTTFNYTIRYVKSTIIVPLILTPGCQQDSTMLMAGKTNLLSAFIRIIPDPAIRELPPSFSSNS
jgi:hypothetical protein